MSAPTRGSTLRAARGIGRPSTRAVPAVGSIRPISMRMVVVLPEPLGPRKPKTLPRGTRRSIPSTARVPRYRLASPRVSITVSPGDTLPPDLTLPPGGAASGGSAIALPRPRIRRYGAAAAGGSGRPRAATWRRRPRPR